MFAFLVSLVLFVGGLALFGYAFVFPEGWMIWGFSAGVAAVALSLIIPFHLLERFD